MKEKIKEFLDIYTEIELSGLSKKDVTDKIQALKDKAKELVSCNLLSESDVNFESDKSFLISVKKFIDEKV